MVNVHPLSAHVHSYGTLTFSDRSDWEKIDRGDELEIPDGREADVDLVMRQ